MHEWACIDTLDVEPKANNLETLITSTYNSIFWL